MFLLMEHITAIRVSWPLTDSEKGSFFSLSQCAGSLSSVTIIARAATIVSVLLQVSKARMLAYYIMPSRRGSS